MLQFFLRARGFLRMGIRLRRGCYKPKRRVGLCASAIDDSLIFGRKAFTWAGGKTLAIWIIPNLETWDFHSAGGSNHFSLGRQRKSEPKILIHSGAGFHDFEQTNQIPTVA